jgi:diadenosine tetraphosphatase ApaH/serine/threonine PP2A family protein phosphatase
MDGFNGPARQSAEWTHNRLRDDLRRTLMEMPMGPVSVADGVEGGYVVSHGSPGDEDTYLLGPREVAEAFDCFEGPLCFFGHTHLPGCWELDEASHALHWIDMEPEVWMPLRHGCRYLANPGSVGQPRDRDNRASFMTCDARHKRIRLHRMEYDWDAEAKAILAAGLHPSLATRLAAGM